MEFSLRSFPQYQKFVKSKRCMNSNLYFDEQSNALGSSSYSNNAFKQPYNIQSKTYHDAHLLIGNQATILKSPNCSGILPYSRQKTETRTYESYSKKRDSKRLSNNSYQLQKTQKSIKAQRAIKNLINIDSISIHHLEPNLQNSVRFNKDVETAPNTGKQEPLFCRWSTLSKEKSIKSKSPTKGKNSAGKRAKNSPTKKSFNLRVRRTFNNAKTISFALNFSTIDSSNRSVQTAKPTRRKSSIAPWETEEQGVF